MPKQTPSAAVASPVPTRAPVVCAFHRCALDETGWCPVAQAWATPRFACPDCGGALWPNGYCENCTPKTGVFPGDYFEGQWGEDAGRAYGHWVRGHRGPTPVLSAEQVDGYLRELRSLVGRVGIGVELKPEYLTLAQKRTQQAGLL